MKNYDRIINVSFDATLTYREAYPQRLWSTLLRREGDVSTMSGVSMSTIYDVGMVTGTATKMDAFSSLDGAQTVWVY